MRDQEKHSNAVLDMEVRIIQEEGSYYCVNGRYYANLSDAALQRTWEAERRVREEERLARVCAWCDKSFKIGERKVAAAFRSIHESPCADEFAAFATPASEVSASTSTEEAA